MKSTNRQILFKLNPAKNYLKMCLLNCILISIVTLTHSLPIQMTLSSAIAKYPKYADTLLNDAVVPFVKECKAEQLKAKQEMLCGSYFEMIDKLDHSNVNGLTTVEDFNKEMKVYNQSRIEEFCVKFLDYLPNEPKEYPNSYKLYKHLPKYCTTTLCLDDDLDAVKPICRVFAIGFQLSNTKVPVQASNPVANSTINKLSTDGSQNSNNARPDDSSKSLQMSDSVMLDKDKSSAAKAINTNGADGALKQKQVIDATVPKAGTNEIDEKNNGDKVAGHEEKTDGKEENIEKKEGKIEDQQVKIDEHDEETAKENSSPNAEAAAEESQKVDIGEGGAKSIDTTSHSKSNQAPTVKQELNPSENPVNNAETAEKAAGINEEDTENVEDMPKDDDDKGSYKVISGEPLEDGDVNTKDKFGNPNEDSFENNDEDELPESAGVQSAKSQQAQPQPSNDQPNQEDPFTDDTDSNFFTYFMFLLFVCVTAYVVYHNKSKMLALMLEGRRSNTSGRSGLSRRKHTAAYRKLDSNLEEAITSSGNGRSTQVIY